MFGRIELDTADPFNGFFFEVSTYIAVFDLVVYFFLDRRQGSVEDVFAFRREVVFDV